MCCQFSVKKNNEKEAGGKLNEMLNSTELQNPLVASKSLSYFPYLLPADQLQKFIHSDNLKIRFHAIDIIARTQNQELLPIIQVINSLEGSEILPQGNKEELDWFVDKIHGKKIEYTDHHAVSFTEATEANREVGGSLEALSCG